MKINTQQIPIFEIARLACQIWQDGGCQSDREQEYWLLAVHQLRANRQSENDVANNAPTKL